MDGVRPLRGAAEDLEGGDGWHVHLLIRQFYRVILASREPITGPPINSAPPEFTIFPCSNGEKERRKPYYQLL